MSHRIYLPPDLIRGEEIVFPQSHIHQLLRVLRMKSGNRISVFTNDGWEYVVELKLKTKQILTGHILSSDYQEFRPTVKVFLFISPLKKDNFDWVLQKCTEIGIFTFVPTIFSRTIKKSNPGNHIYERWNRILIEASEQSGRRYIPEITPINIFDETINISQKCDLILIPWEEERKQQIFQFQNIIKPEMNIGIFIGPEGGIEKEEIQIANNEKTKIVSLGTNILRAETAAIVACSQVIIYGLCNTSFPETLS